MSNYRGDLGEHLIVGKVKISRKIILPNVHGVDGVPESFTVNRCPLSCISKHVILAISWRDSLYYFIVGKWDDHICRARCIALDKRHS